MENKNRPRLGCAAIIRDNADNILLGWRNKEPNKGKLVLPGGGVKWGEPLEVALTREVFEETGLSLRAGSVQFFRPYEIIHMPDEHRVILYYSAEACDGELRGGDDLSEPRFYSQVAARSATDRGEVSPFVAHVLRNWWYSRRI